MRTEDLRHVVERHRRVLRAQQVHVMADEHEMLVGTAVASGHVMMTRMPGVRSAVHATLDAEILLAGLVGDGDVHVEASGGDVVVRTKRGRTTIPSQSEEPPHVPGLRDHGSRVEGADLAWLREALRRVALAKMTDGSMNIERDANGVLCVCTYDEVHGAFCWNPSQCDLRLGLQPSDAVLVASLMQGERCRIGMSDDNRLVVRDGTDVLVLPCIQAGAMPRSTVMGNTRHAWTTTVDDLQTAVRACATVAKAKDASPVRIATGGDWLVVSSSASTGSIDRRVPLTALKNAHPSINCNVDLVRDVLDRIAAGTLVQGWVEPGDEPSPRLILRTPDTTYVILTSSG